MIAKNPSFRLSTVTIQVLIVVLCPLLQYNFHIPISQSLSTAMAASLIAFASPRKTFLNGQSSHNNGNHTTSSGVISTDISASTDVRSDKNDTTGPTGSATRPTTIFTTKEQIITDYDGAGTLGDIMAVDPSDTTPATTATSTSTSTSNNYKLEKNPNIQNNPFITNNNTSPPSSSLLSTKTITTKTKSTITNPSIQNGLVTSTGGTLQNEFVKTNKIPNLSPLDRIALTANGNLQRIFSSYYDAPVHVHIDHCDLMKVYLNNGDIDGDGNDCDVPVVVDDRVWERQVTLSVFGQVM